MSDITVHVAGAGSYLPPRRVDNATLYGIDGIRRHFDVERARGSLREEDAADLSPEDVFDRWAVQVTGIRERRIAGEGPGATPEEMMAAAARRALEDGRMEAGDLDLIVVATVTAAEDVPNAACTVGALLGVPRVAGFTLNAACAGFVYALASAAAFVRAGASRNALVLAGDMLSKVTDFDDPKTAVLFADGAGGVVLSADRGRGRVLGTPALVADYSPDHLNLAGAGWLPAGGPTPTLSMAGGPNVLRQAIQAMTEVGETALASAGLRWADLDYVVPHQANRRITRGLARSLKLEKGRVVDVIERYGNVSASTVPIALDEVLRGEHGSLADPCRILLTAVGGGYTSGAAVLEFGAA